MMDRGIKIKSAISERGLPSIIGRWAKKKRMKSRKKNRVPEAKRGYHPPGTQAKARGEPQFMYVDAHSIHLIQPHHLHVCCKIERGLVSWFEDRSRMLCVMYVGVDV